MALRKASAYSKKIARPYTRRSYRKTKAYIKVVPGSKIVKFKMGNIKSYNEGKFKYHVRLRNNERIQVRDNSLEACRMLVNKVMEAKAPGQFYFEVRVYPHHLLRENKTAAGAGADRLSSGMKHSFGIVIGRAAIVNAGNEILFVACAGEKEAKLAREALHMIKSKVPGSTSVVFEKAE